MKDGAGCAERGPTKASAAMCVSVTLLPAALLSMISNRKTQRHENTRDPPLCGGRSACVSIKLCDGNINQASKHLWWISQTPHHGSSISKNLQPLLYAASYIFIVFLHHVLPSNRGLLCHEGEPHISRFGCSTQSAELHTKRSLQGY